MVAKSIIYYFLPLSIIGVLYALMARRLHLSAREMPGELVGPQRAQARARRHVARMVVTFVIGKWFTLLFKYAKKKPKKKPYIQFRIIIGDYHIVAVTEHYSFTKSSRCLILIY